MEKRGVCRRNAIHTIESETGEEIKFSLGIAEILPYIGDFGRYQKLLIALVSLLYIPVAVHPFLVYFATIVPSWRCTGNSTICSFNGTLSADDTRRCDLPRSEWTYTEERLFSIVTNFDLSCDELWIVSLITFGYFAGWGVGAIVVGLLADRFGRKRSLLPSVIVTLTVGVVNPFMPSVYLTVLGSFTLGVCYPGVETQASIILAELVATKWRPVAARISTLMFPVMWMLLALKANLLRNWRNLSLVCSVPYVFTIAIAFFIPESVYWLQLHGRPEEAREILEKVGRLNKKELPSMIVVSQLPANFYGTRSTIKDVFGTRELAIQSSALMIIWCFTLLCYYGLIIGSADLDGDTYKDFALVSAMEMPGILLAVVACQKIGRKGSTLIMLAIGGAASLMVPWIPMEGYNGTIRLLLGIIGRLAVGINYNSMLVWTTELYPTRFRSTAFGVMHASARIGAASSPWIVKGMKPFGQWIPFTVMGVSALIGSLSGLCLQETKGIPLQEHEGDAENDPRRSTFQGPTVIGAVGPFHSFVGL